MRVKVKVDIAKPFCHGRLITLKNGEKTWVVFKYARLPNFCFWCGRLSHGDRDCLLWVIYVPGFYDKSGLKEDEGLRRRDHDANGVVGNEESEERVAENSIMETEDFEEELNLVLNIEKGNVINLEKESEIKGRVNELESNREALNSIKNSIDKEHDSGKGVLEQEGNSKNMRTRNKGQESREGGSNIFDLQDEVEAKNFSSSQKGDKWARVQIVRAAPIESLEIKVEKKKKKKKEEEEEEEEIWQQAW
ncbi:hypothetical protein CFP56_037582 [Quercus suber]|uniref:Zinc knuckle CX2CX4HX4C domain-containing protein n=1 Tax=Quercus suber TaxID=58331 RepID=A0AAW0J5H5_QUESU